MKISSAILILLWLFLSETTEACSVCFGNPNSNQSKSVVLGVLFLMGVILFVLTYIVVISLIWARRAKKLAQETAKASL